MSSKVYFINLRSRTDKTNKISKIKRLFDAAGFNELIQPSDLTAVKLTFGERGSDGNAGRGFKSGDRVGKAEEEPEECGERGDAEQHANQP